MTLWTLTVTIWQKKKWLDRYTNLYTYMWVLCKYHQIWAPSQFQSAILNKPFSPLRMKFLGKSSFPWGPLSQASHRLRDRQNSTEHLHFSQDTYKDANVCILHKQSAWKLIWSNLYVWAFWECLGTFVTFKATGSDWELLPKTFFFKPKSLRKGEITVLEVLAPSNLSILFSIKCPQC